MKQFQREQVVSRFLDITAQDLYEKVRMMPDDEITFWSDLPIGESISSMIGLVLKTEQADYDKLYIRGIAATCDELLLKAVHTFGDPEWNPSEVE